VTPSSYNRPVIIEHVLDIAEEKILNDRQKKLLEMIEKKGEVGRAEYVEMFKDKLSITSLYWDLRKLSEMGIVKRRRKGRFSYYSLR